MRLQNLTAKATTYFNNRNVQPDEQVELKDGDRFRLYDTELRFRNFKPNDPHLETVTGKQIPIIRLVGKDKHGGPQTPPSNKVSSGLRSPKTEKTKSPHNSSRSADRMNKSMPGNSRVELDRTPKRRKSSDVDMRRAVLKKTFRKSVQGRTFPEEIPERQEAGEEEDEDEQEELNGDDDSINEQVDTDSTFVTDSASDLGSRENTEKATYIVPENESVDLLSPVVMEKPMNEEKQNNSEDLIQFEDIEREMFALHEGGDKASGSSNEPTVEDGKSNGSTADSVDNEKNSTSYLVEGTELEKSKCNGEDDTSSTPAVECDLPEIGYDSFSSRWDDSFTTGGKSFHTAASEDDDERNLSFEPMEVDEIPCTQNDIVGDSTFYDSCTNLDATTDIFQSSIVGSDEHPDEPDENDLGPQTVTQSISSVEIEAPDGQGAEIVNDGREESKAKCELDSGSQATTVTEDSQDAVADCQHNETAEAIELELASLFHSEVEAPPATTTVSQLADDKDSEEQLPDVEQDSAVNSNAETETKPQDESCEQEELESSKFEISSPLVDLEDDSNDNEGPLPDVVTGSVDCEVLQIVEVVDTGESVNDFGKDNKEELNLEHENADDLEGSVVSASDVESVEDVPAHVSSVEIMEMETQVIIIEENAANIDSDEKVETLGETPKASKNLTRESVSPREKRRTTRSMANASIDLGSKSLQIPEATKESIQERAATPEVPETQEILNEVPGTESPASSPVDGGTGRVESPIVPQSPVMEMSASAAASVGRVLSPNDTGKISMKSGETPVAQRRSSRKSVSTPEVEEEVFKNVSDDNYVEAGNAAKVPRRSVHVDEPTPSLQDTVEVEIDLTDSNDEGFMMRSALTTPRRSSRKQRNNEHSGRNAMTTPRSRATRAASKSELQVSTPSRKRTRSSESSDVEVIEVDPVGPKSTPVAERTISPEAESESPSGLRSENDNAPTRKAEISFPSADSDIEADLESVADFNIRHSAQNVPEGLEIHREVIAEEEEKEEEDLVEEGDETPPSMEVSQGEDPLDKSLSSQSSAQETETVKPDIVLKECSVVLKRLVMDFDETSSEEDEMEETENVAQGSEVASEPELEEAETSETAVEKAEPALERSPSPKISSPVSEVISPVAASVTPQKTGSTSIEKTPASSKKRETLVKDEAEVDSPRNANRRSSIKSMESEPSTSQSPVEVSVTPQKTGSTTIEKTPLSSKKREIPSKDESGVDSPHNANRRSSTESIELEPNASESPVAVSITPQKTGSKPIEKTPLSSKKRETLSKGVNAVDSPRNANSRSSTESIEPKPSTSSSPEIKGNSPPPVQFKTLFGVKYDASIKLCNLNIVVTRLEEERQRERRNTRQRSSVKESSAPREEDVEYVDLEDDEESESSSTPAETSSSLNKSRRRSRQSLQEVAKSRGRRISDGDSDSPDGSTALSDTNQQSTSPVSSPRKTPPKNSGSSSGVDEIVQEDMKTAEDEVSDAETIPVIRSKPRAQPMGTPKSTSRRKSEKLAEVLELDSDEEEIKSPSDLPSQTPKTRKSGGRGKRKTVEEAITQVRNEQQTKAASEKGSQSSDADEEEGATQSRPVVDDHDGITRKAISKARSKRAKLHEDAGPTETLETKESDRETAAPETSVKRKDRRAQKTKEAVLVAPSPHGRRTRAQEVEIIQQIEPAKPGEDEEAESNDQEANNFAKPNRRGRRVKKENAAVSGKKQVNKSPNKGSTEGSADSEVLIEEKVGTAGSKSRSKRGVEVSESAREPEPEEDTVEKTTTAKTGRRKVKTGKTDSQKSDHEQPQEEPEERLKSRRARNKKDSDDSSQERIANATSSSSDSAGRSRRQKPVPVVDLDDDEEPVRKKAKKGKEIDHAATVQQEQKKSQKSVVAPGKSNVKPVVELTRIDVAAQSPRLTRSQSTDSEQVVPGPSSLPPPPKRKARGRKKVDEGSSSKDDEPPSDTESVSSRTRGRKGKEPESDSESVSGLTRGRKVDASDKKTKVATQSAEVRAKKKAESHAKKEAPASSSRTTRNKVRAEEVIELESEEEEKPKPVEKPKKIRPKVQPVELSESEAENEKPKTRSERRGNTGVVQKHATKDEDDDDDGKVELKESKTKRRRKPEVKEVRQEEAPKTRKGRAKAVSKSDSEEIVVPADVRTQDVSPDIENSDDEVVSQQEKPSTSTKATKSSKRLKRTEDEEVVVESESRRNRRRLAVPSETAESDNKIEKRTKTRQVNGKQPKVTLQLPETNSGIVEVDLSSDEEERPKPKAKRARTEKEPAKSPVAATRTTRRRARN